MFILHHLRVVLPAAAGIIWALQKLQASRSEPQSAPPSPEQDDEGEEVEVELPPPPAGSGKGPQMPFPTPPPLKAVLLDVEVSISLAALWLALFHGSSSLLDDFHKHLGDLEIRVSPWRRKDEQRRRVLQYTTPLKNPLGPRQARNTEVLEAVQLSSNGFLLRAVCSSEGVPFASCFANHIQWVATPHGAHSCRLLITGECRFHSPVWGPLKGQIERESVKGMAKAYLTLFSMLEQKYGATPSDASIKAFVPPSLQPSTAAVSSPSKHGSKLALGADATQAGSSAAAGAAAAARAGDREGEGLNISALLQNPQTNAAAFLLIVVAMALLWRIMFMHPLAMQAVRGVAGAAGAAVAGR